MARHNKKHEQRKKSRTPHQEKASRPADPNVTAQYVRKIRIFLQMTARKQMKASELANKCRSKRAPSAYLAALEQLLHEGVILEKRDAYVLCSKDDCFPWRGRPPCRKFRICPG